MTNYHILTIRLDLNGKSKHIASIRKQNPDGLEDAPFVSVMVFYDEKKAKAIRNGKIQSQKGRGKWRRFGTTVITEESCIRKSMLAAYEAQAKTVFKLREKGWNVDFPTPEKKSFVYIIHLKKSVKKVKRFKKQNPGKGPFKGFLYMGQTTNDPVSERYRIHTVKVDGKKHKLASSIVHNHENGIAWELFKEHTEPMTKLEALRLEKQLAISYKKEGYATYWS